MNSPHQNRSGLGRARFPRLLPWLLSLLPFGHSAALLASELAAPPIFVDVGQEAGLSFQHVNGTSAEKYLVETMGSGGGFLDFDNDGWLDVYLVNSGPTPTSRSTLAAPNRLFRNGGDGTFTDVTEKAGVGDSSYGMGSAFADYDNDGFVDIYVTNLGPNILYRNNGDGTFSDVTNKVGVGDPLWSSSAAFGDYDGDGNLDLYVANYLRFSFASHRTCYASDLLIYCYPHSYDGAPNTLYRNLGNGSFETVTGPAGVKEDPQYSKTLGVLWFDMDSDRDLDLYVVNDTTANYLYENKGKGKFEDVALLSGAAFNGMGMAQSGMGVDAADLTGNGRFAMFVTNFSMQTNDLYWNQGDGTFSDHTLQAELATPSFMPLGFGANFFDYDNDGWTDLFVANGHVFDNIATINPSLEHRQPNQLFHNEGKGRFSSASSQAGPYFSVKNVSRGSAVGDFNNDGRVDLLVMNNNDKVDLLQNRVKTPNHWLKLKLKGTHCNRDGVGTKVVLTAGSYSLTQEVRAGSSYLSQSDPRLHFGLGDRDRIDSIRVSWPCGKDQAVEPPSRLDQIIHVEEARAVSPKS